MSEITIEEYQEIVKSCCFIKDKEIEALKFTIGAIAEIIWMEMPLRYQDNWLENIMEQGLWKPDEDLVEGMKK